MTVPKDVAKITRELNCYRERERTQWQLVEVAWNLSSTLFQIGIAWWIFNLAIVGIKHTFPMQISPGFQLIVWAFAIMWILWYLPFACYRPIEKDAIKGFGIIANKIKNAKEGWDKK